MECQRCASLVVLTLLQLCRAEHIQQQWYSANINDGFQPKPISEIFSTEPTFSTSKPIVVTQKNSNVSEEVDLLSSTLTTPSSPADSTRYSQQTVNPTTISTTMPPLYQQQLGQFNPLTHELDLLRQQQTYLQPHMPSYVPPVQLISQIPQQQHIDSQLQLRPEVAPQVQRNIDLQPLIEPGQSYTAGLPLTTLFQQQTQSTQGKSNGLEQFDTQQPIQTVTNSPSSSSIPPNLNYFLVYQNVPQTIQTLPPSAPPSSPANEVTIRESTPTTVFSTTQTLPTSSLSSTTQLPTTWLSTTPRTTDWTSTISSSGVTVTPSSTFGLSSGGCITSTTPLPLLLNPQLKQGLGLPLPLKIRVIAPTGSITNVNINPLTTTKTSMVTKSTTRKPTTRRTSKPKKNSHDRCLDGCRKVKDPICAAPLSHYTIDPKTLRGFPSVCHMACHNSYRKDPFEKVIEGSCGKLRDRIRLIDSKSKLKKEDLHKTAYIIDERAPKTVVEFTGVAQ